MATTYNWYNDPGHGWLRVPRSELVELEIDGLISGYSYISPDGRWVYLEEDMDAGVYITARVLAGLGWPATREHHANNDSRIRRYPRFPVTACWESGPAWAYLSENHRRVQEARS